MNQNLLKQIFSYLKFDDVFNLNLVNKTFYKNSIHIDNKWDKILNNKFLGKEKFFSIFNNQEIHDILQLHKIEIKKETLFNEEKINFKNIFIKGLKIDEKFSNSIIINSINFFEFYKNDKNEIIIYKNNLWSLFELINANLKGNF